MDQLAEPLDPHSWIAAIARLHERIAVDADWTHYERHLRNAFTLSQLAPAALGDIFASEASEGQFDTYLRSGDFDRAATELLNPALKLITVERDGTLASEVHAPIFEAVGTADEASPRGIVLAWTQCVMLIADRVDEIAAEVTHPDRHKPRSEPRPPSNSH